MSFYSDRMFPAVNDLLTRSFVRHRQKVLSSAKGKILEIGFGSGLSLPCYPVSVSEVMGLEPNIGMLKKAQGLRANSNEPKLQIIEGRAEQIPFPEKEFDAVVSFLTLCSVSDLNTALTEIKRVLKPQGRLFFIEHVIQPDGSLTRQIQERIQPLWGRLACGCHVNRNTIGELRAAGFDLELKSIGYGGFPNFLGPTYRGIASLK